MKKLLTLFSLLIAIAGCTNTQVGNRKLAAVEKTVANNPYSAFGILDSMNKEDLKTARDTALYNLLYVSALHKMNLYTLNDSMIECSEQYFRHSEEKYYLLLTYLHHGISFYYNHKYKNAIIYLKRAEQMADKNNEDNLKYEVFTCIAKTNNDANCKDLALKYYKKSLTCCDTTKGKGNYARSLNDIAAIYEDKGQTDSFKVYIRQCIKILNGTDVKSDVLTNIGNYYLKIGNKNKARKYLEEAMRTSYEYETAKILGDMYASEGMINKAVEYYYQSVESRMPEVRIYSYHKLIDYYSKTGNNKRELDLSERLNKEYTNFQEVNSGEIAKYQADWDEHIAKDKENRRIILLIDAIGLLLIMILSFTYLHHRKMRKYGQIIEEMNAQYAADLEQYKKTKNELRKLQSEKQQNETLITEKLEEIDTLQQKLSGYQEDKQLPSDWNIEDTLMNEEIIYHLHNLASHGRTASINDWKDLHESTNKNMPHFIPSISKLAILTNKDMNICLLTRLRFIPSEIASLTSSSPQSVTNCRVRLLEKIFGIKGGAKVFDEKIREI